ncbi:MAG: hypothetical protein JWM86_1695 [Thermoleophilia bacterium]|nr:hypothetical protein [Thermoleophilia bacterium]
MTLRNRILDLLPVLIVFAVVTAFAIYCLVAFIVREPVLDTPRTQQAGYAAPAPGTDGT